MAKNIKPNEMVESVLFKAVAPFIKSISSSELLYQLCVASTTADVSIDRHDLDACMVWNSTPQKQVYWSNLNTEFNHNRWEGPVDD